MESVCSTEHTQLYVLPYLIKQLKEIDQVKGLYADIIQYKFIADEHSAIPCQTQQGVSKC